MKIPKTLELKSVSGAGTVDVPFELKAIEDGDVPGAVEGYGAVFNLTDLGGDILLPGAFKKSIADWKKRKAAPPMLWQHSPSQPIGLWTELSEDERGLKVKGELILDVPQAAACYALVKRGALKGLSIGYRTVEAEIDRGTGARRLKRVDLWEISLVVFPMMPEALIAAVKEFDPREMEEALRDAGLSRSDCKTAVAIFRDTLRRDAGEPGQPHREGARDLLMTLRKATELVRTP